MKAGHVVRALVFALALAPATRAQSEPQPEPPRRPQGPAAGPVIKLPPGAGSVEERAQAPGAKEQAAPAPPRQWEYCFINAFRLRQKSFGIGSSTQVHVASVRYLPEGSEEFEGATEEEALAGALFKLGEDGWELTAVRTDLRLDDGDGKTTHAYFFKRPKRQE